MMWTTQGSHLLLQDPEPFDLNETLDCGQAFRWERLPDGRFQGVARGRFLVLGWRPEGLLLENTPAGDAALWEDYFDLGRAYAPLLDRFREDPVLAQAIAFAPGIRVLRQDGWEALCSFIISQNNNIPRIKGIIRRLCHLLGAPAGPEGWHDFPTPQRLAATSLEELAPVRAGFRAKYLLDAARKVVSGQVDLAAIPAMETPRAQEELCKILGVGPKVAQCALLYGFGKVDCFPQDVWIKRVVAQLYPQGFPPQLADCAGIAQQYLFHYARSNPHLFD